MRSQKLLLVDQLDRKLKVFRVLRDIQIPSGGWIKTIRKTLSMTLMQLADKLKVDYRTIQGYEEREIKGRISIKTLREVGEALGMEFVYGFVPIDGSVQNMIDKKAKELARKIVLKTHRNMLLEDQGTEDHQLRKAIEELSEELKRDISKSLWN